MGDGYSAQCGGAELTNERRLELPRHLPVKQLWCLSGYVPNQAGGTCCWGWRVVESMGRRGKQIYQLQHCAGVVLGAGAGASSLRRSASWDFREGGSLSFHLGLRCWYKSGMEMLSLKRANVSYHHIHTEIFFSPSLLLHSRTPFANQFSGYHTRGKAQAPRNRRPP